MLDEGSAKAEPMTDRAARALLFSALMLIQVLAPLTTATPSQGPERVIDTDLDPILLDAFGVKPQGDLAEGWFEPTEAGHVDLAHRTSALVAPSDWAEWTGERGLLDGWFVLGTTWPVPTTWEIDLADAGVECGSFLPPAAFHCNVSGLDPAELEALGVRGLQRLAPSDRVQEGLLEDLIDHDGPVLASAMLSGERLPETLPQSVEVLDQSGRFVTFLLTAEGLSELLHEPTLEWVEPKPWYVNFNDEARHIMNVTGVSSGANMAANTAGWTGLDGTGVIVTVADTGLDNGVNNSNMHPDFADHIVDVVSFGVPSGTCSFYSLTTCNDGAADEWSGHGTHVAGSVLGDGTHSNGAIQGAAPEARLYFQAIETEATISGTTDGYLLGIPNNLYDLFEPAYDNGSRVHTNSWGSAVNGQYTTSSAQADASAHILWDMAIL
ncbi:MAG TPA: hypothetical protein D7I05_08285, partial [Candidatus Poseidoniales archaeon]